MKIAPADAFAPPAPLPLQQHPLYGKALGLLGRLVETVPLSLHGQVIGQAQVVWRDFGPLGVQGLIARGPLFEAGMPDEQAHALRDLAPQGLRMIEAEGPCPALPLAGYRQVMTGAHLAELPLFADAARRHAAAHPKWRASLRHAQAAGLTLRSQPYRGEADHWLIVAEARTRRAKGYHGLPGSLPQALGQADKHALRLFWAERDGAPVAGMLFVRHGAAATYLLGWTGGEGRATCAHHLILDHAAAWLAARGHIRLDLGQVDTHAAPGLARFKIGTGAQVRQLGGSWLRLPFCGHPRRRGALGTGNAPANPLHAGQPDPSATARHDPDDPATLRKPRPAHDRPAAHHRAGAGGR